MKEERTVKANILTRMIFDTENNKAYLSVEGKVESATVEEKIRLRNTLVDAFSYIFGLSTSSQASQVNVVNDFEVDENIKEEEIPQFLGDNRIKAEDSKKKENAVNDVSAEKVPKEPVKKTVQEERQEEKRVVMKIGRYPDMTAAEIIAKDGEKGVKYLKHLLPILEKNLDRFPDNREKIESINIALRKYEEGGGKCFGQ